MRCHDQNRFFSFPKRNWTNFFFHFTIPTGDTIAEHNIKLIPTGFFASVSGTAISLRHTTLYFFPFFHFFLLSYRHHHPPFLPITHRTDICSSKTGRPPSTLYNDDVSQIATKCPIVDPNKSFHISVDFWRATYGWATIACSQDTVWRSEAHIN